MTLNLKVVRLELTLTLLVTPVLFLLCQSKMSAVKKKKAPVV